MASAKQIRDEIMKMTIIVNSDPAQNEIRELSKANTEFRKEVEKLTQKKKELGKETEDNKKQHKELADEIKRLNSTIYSNNEKIEELRGGMEITKMTMGQLRKEAQLLRLQLRDVIPGSDAAKLLESQLSKVNTRISDVEKSSRNTQSSFQQLSSKFQQYSGIVTAVTAVLFGFGVSVQQIISKNNELSDAISQVQKNANMTKKEVEDLTRSFSDMDTRTSKIDLLKIANEGGKLGVAKEDIKGFVVEVDKANVALGDSFEGGASAVANSLGKISGLYKETKDQNIAKSINEIGSGLNELAANGAASEQNIAEFAIRIGGLPDALKPTISDTLGLGAAFEESGIDAERAGTAYTTVISTAAKEAKGFAYVMKLPVDKVKEMINTNPTEFFLKFSEGLKGMDAVGLAKTLDFLKLNDQYVKSIVGAASDSTDRFRETIELSNQAVKQGISLQSEFDKMNYNAAAVFEKLKNKFTNLYTSDAVAHFLDKSINAFALFIGINEKADKELSVFGRTTLTIIRAIAIFTVSFFSLGAAIATYNLLIKDSIAREIILQGLIKVKNTATGIATAVQSGYNLVVGKGTDYLSKLINFIALKTNSTKLETTATNLQTAAEERLNKVTKASPLGLIIAVLSVAITAYITYKSLVEDTATAQEQLNEVLKEGSKNAGAEVNALEQTYKKLTNKNIAEKDRQKLLDEANKQYPGFFKNLTIEDFLLGKAAGQYNKLRTAIIAASQARAADAKINEIAGKYLEQEVELTEIIKKAQKDLKGNFTDQTRTYVGQSGGGTYTVTANEQRGGVLAILNRAKKELAELQRQKIAELNPLIDIVDKNPFKNQETATPDITPTYKVPGSTDTENSAENAQKRLLEDYKRRADEAGNLSIELEKEINEKKIEAMEDGFAKELALIDEQERQKLAELEKKKITPEEIKKLQEIEAKATGTDKEFFSSLLKQWEANNKEIENAKTAEINYFNDKRGALIQKNAIEEEKRSYDLFQKELEVLNREKNEKIGTLTTVQDQINFLREKGYTENLDKIKTWEQGVAEIEKYYQAQSLKRQLEFLKSKVAVLKASIALGDFSNLTPEGLKTIEDYKNKIAELQAQIAKLLNKEDDKTPKKLSVGGKTDILGLSADDWDTLFKNIESGKIGLDSWIAGIEAVKNAFNSYYSLVQAKEQAQVRQVEVAAKRKEKSLKNQLDRGIISQEEYEASVQSLNEETERKKAQLEYEAAKRQRVIQVGQIIANTAIAIMKIWSETGPFVAPILTGVVSALGALQVATVLATPLPEAPGYEQGFGMEYDMMREQDGKKFRTVRRRLTSGLVDRPTHFIAGENGVEMVIDNPTYTKFPESVKRTLNRQIAIAKGYEGGRYPYLSNGNDTSSPKDDLMIELLMENREAIKELRKTRFTAVVDKNDMRSAKNIIEMQDDYNYLKNK